MSLPIYVDFQPARESLKPTSSCVGKEHDYFIVPKTVMYVMIKSTDGGNLGVRLN